MTGQVEFVPVGEPIDIDNCAREPIHIPGAVQPRGFMLSARDSDGVVLQCSTNVTELLERGPDQVVGHGVDEVLGAGSLRTVLDQLASAPDSRVRNPGFINVPVGDSSVPMDVVVHRPPGADGNPVEGVVVIELEPADGARPLTFGTTYEVVRDAIADLNRSSTLDELYDSAARHVRRMTGFDRVMVYRFDAEYNGEVVAEARRGDLEPFLGLHYPASDIPPQARALYERSWIRLISDVDYRPAAILPVDEPTSGQPLDLTFASLRSVSPIHLEYLRNMGVRASMSISLLRDGKLWGMLACHHYSGAHAPLYGMRAAAEFLGVALSARLVAQVDQDLLEESRRTGAILARLVAAASDEQTALEQALTSSQDLLELIPADGVLVKVGDTLTGLGRLPDERHRQTVLAWAAGIDGVRATDQVSTELDSPVPGVAGALAIGLPDENAVVWLRDEHLRTVEWGGDPTHKNQHVDPDGSIRLSPRTSFALWSEQVRGRSKPWAEECVSAAEDLRPHLVESLYQRGRRDVRIAQMVQRSLLPRELPALDGWTLDAQYSPANGGRIGGDWFDALVLPSGDLMLAVGDVTGHGLPAAAAMGQLRNAARAFFLEGQEPAAVLERMAALARWTMPGQNATIILVVIDPSTGDYRYATAGHLPPLVLAQDGPGRWESLQRAPLLGLLNGRPPQGAATLAPGQSLVLLSDGTIERRGESLLIGMDRAADVLRADGTSAADLMARVRDPESDDDATIVVVTRS